MARKNPFANLREDDGVQKAQPALDYAMKGASRSLLSSFDEIASRADKLVEGETIVEIDPDSVDDSFVRDRLAADDEEFSNLLQAIRERGQDSPILVRPHPSKAGRYMVVFGHRRVRAAKLLERKVRAVVKEMKDREHVIAQGQENSARANLSFIEKALFAARIARLNYDEDNATILTALAIDRATLSKMLSVAALPSEVLKAIGPAKGIGRDRWYELKLMLERSASLDRALSVIGDNEFSVLPSDDRFNALVSRVKAAKSSVRGHPRQSKRNWAPEDGSLAAEMTSEGKRFTLALKARGADAKAFGEYLSENLAQFYEAFRQEKTAARNGD
jgi:ParB family transcriptional regulator, chromosome partitioning protein